MEKESDPFWLDDYSVLYKNKNYIRFFPTLRMTRVEQLNSITRFAIYMFVMFVLAGEHKAGPYVALLIILVCVAFYQIDVVHKRMMGRKERETMISLGEDERRAIKNNSSGSDTPYQKRPLNLDPNKLCVRPTRDNPFMNFLVSDYVDYPDKPPACDQLENPDVKHDMIRKFEHNLYKNVDELWDRFNSQRQYYTTPNTLNPNAQKDFAEWLYKMPETCKTDQEHCLKYEDLRFQRR